jgi:hypothetical protein
VVSAELRAPNFVQIIVTLNFLAASDDSATTADTHIVRIANARTVLIFPSEARNEPLATAPRTVAIELAAPANAFYRSVDVYVFLIKSLRRYGWGNIRGAWLAVTYRR